MTPSFIVDENLPQTLVAKLGAGSLHATDLGERMSDIQLWLYAKQHEQIVVTKDADFFDRLSLEGSPPKVVWVRLGNMRRTALETEILRRWPEVLGLLGSANLVEIHGDRLEAFLLGA